MDLGFKVCRMYRFDNGGSTKAICDVTIDNQFVVKGFRIVEGKNGLFVSFPRQPGKDGKWYSNAFPLTPETRQYLDEAVLSAYEDNQC